MIGDLVIFAVVAVAVGGGGIAAGMLVGRRLERHLAGVGEPELVAGPNGDPEDAGGGHERPTDAPAVEEAR